MGRNRIQMKAMSLVVVLALAAGSIALAGCTMGQHEPYSQNFSSLETASDFSLGGESRYFDKLKPGEESILLFWGSWCPHCESLIDSIDQMDGVGTVKKNLFTVAEDEGLDDIEAHEGDFPIYLDQDKSVYEAYELEHIPTVFILSDQGDVLGSAQGEEDSLVLLQEYTTYNQ